MGNEAYVAIRTPSLPLAQPVVKGLQTEEKKSWTAYVGGGWGGSQVIWT